MFFLITLIAIIYKQICFLNGNVVYWHYIIITQYENSKQTNIKQRKSFL